MENLNGRPCYLYSRGTLRQPSNCDKGDIVVAGFRHMSCWDSIFALTGLEQNDFYCPTKNKRMWEEGFLTDDNLFLTRKEAYELVKESGQLIKKVDANGDVFYESLVRQFRGEKNYTLKSEDLW
jgi:hypothetical protein